MLNYLKKPNAAAPYCLALPILLAVGCTEAQDKTAASPASAPSSAEVSKERIASDSEKLAEELADVIPISKVQGSGMETPMKGIEIIIEGIVTGDYQDTGLGGFYIQEEPHDQDDNPQTSEGIFVHAREPEVGAGDVVRISGVAEEHEGQTQIGKGAKVEVTGSAIPQPFEIALPIPREVNWERYEGMLLTFPQTLSVTETYSLGRYGEVSLSLGGRLFNPTQVAMPGEEARIISEQNNRLRILLDDGNTEQNRKPVAYLGENETLRGGSTVEHLTAVLGYAFGAYRFQPVGKVEFKEGPNPRTSEPPEVGGDFRVASFNVLNYFNGDGKGSGFPTARGAHTLAEFQRQRAKIINAISALDADVVGLMEMENDGYGSESSIQDLVNGLNEKAGAEIWTFVEPSFGLGTDAIRVALIYNISGAELVGEPATTTDSPFNFRRPPLAASFRDSDSGGVITVAVNHFKSKGCGSAAGTNADQGDGQGCWNAERTEAAETLADWLASDPTEVNDPDYLIIGDLNAYANEDPLRLLQLKGYTDLAKKMNENDVNYSYVYKGEYGTLDYALATKSLLSQVTGASEWHINSDEPIILDYNMEYNPQELYSEDVFRSSDHDPVLVGLELTE